MSDPFDVLRITEEPVRPGAVFGDRLRQQLLTLLLGDRDGAVTANAPSSEFTDRSTLNDQENEMETELMPNTITPYLCVNGAANALDFYRDAFGGVERHRLVGDDGRIGHAEIAIGNSVIMLADEFPEIDVLSPTTRGGSSTNFTLSVLDVDAVFGRAVAAGATVLSEVADQFYGHRSGTLIDPFGHQWTVSSPIAGFSEEQYVSNSAEQGFTVERTD